MPEKILIVDDESHVRESTRRLLDRKGYDVEGAESGSEALDKIAKDTFNLLLLDIKMPGMSGLELLRQAKEINPDIIALIMTGYGTVENAIEALELGALGFVRKPLPIDELANIIDDTLARGRMRTENARLRALMPLFELSKVFLSEVDESQLLGLVLDTVISETKVDLAQILLWDETGNLIIKANRGLKPKEGIGSIVIDEMVVKAASTLEPVVVSSKNDNVLNIPEKTKLQRIDCNIYVPLIVRGEAIGVLKATKLGNKTFFKQSDIEFLLTLCGQAAIAIANATLFENLQAKQTEVEELLNRVINTSEDERLRLSLELHDGPVQSIIASQYGVEACRLLISKNQLSKVDSKLHSTQKTLAQSTHDLRRIVRDLHPPTLDKSGLVSAIQDYLSNLEKDDGISYHFEVKGTPIRLDPSIERGVYYVVREALTNVRKHADASEVRVVIKFQDDSLEIDIADNGKGFDASAEYVGLGTEHLGIKGMKERARMLNANLVMDSKPGDGTRVKLVVPISNAGVKESAAMMDRKRSRSGR